MVSREKVMSLLLNDCPSFSDKWKEHIKDIWDRESETILYTDFSEFARHLCELVIHQEYNEFQAVFSRIEYLLNKGDSFVQEAVVVGLLEDFQGNLEREGYSLDIIDRYLYPETKKYWDKVIKFWSGEIPFIDNN